MTTQFAVGETYATRSLADWECIYSHKVHARTAGTITITVEGKQVRRGIRVIDDVETVKPYGSYSMCAVLWANKTLADVERQK